MLEDVVETARRDFTDLDSIAMVTMDSIFLILAECSDGASMLLIVVFLIPFVLVGVLVFLARGRGRTTGIIPVTIDFLQSKKCSKNSI